MITKEVGRSFLGEKCETSEARFLNHRMRVLHQVSTEFRCSDHMLTRDNARFDESSRVPRWIFPLPKDYDLRSALRCLSLSRRDPSRKRLPNGGCRKLFRLDEQLCRLTIGADNRRIVVQLDGEAVLSEAEVLAVIALDDTPRFPLRSNDPLLTLPANIRNFRFGRICWPLEAVLQTILHQRVSGAEASKNWSRLCYRFGTSWDGLVSPPSAEVILGMSPAHFASCGIEHKRMVAMKEVAFRLRGRLSSDVSPQDYGRSVRAIRGIGVWTEQYVRGHFLGDPDAVPLGDYDLPHLVSYFFQGERRGTDERMLQLLEPYRGQRFRVLTWLGYSGVGPPRRGARLPLGSLLNP